MHRHAIAHGWLELNAAGSDRISEQLSQTQKVLNYCFFSDLYFPILNSKLPSIEKVTNVQNRTVSLALCLPPAQKVYLS